VVAFSLFAFAFLETRKLWRSPYRLKCLSDPSIQKIAAKKIGSVERSFILDVEVSTFEDDSAGHPNKLKGTSTSGVPSSLVLQFFKSI
jgi:hypothetical protein